MDKLIVVALGGGCGAVGRYVVAQWFVRLTGISYAGTMLVNVVGSLIMGVLAVLLLERWAAGSGRLAPFLMTGLLGGFTTFSAFSLDCMHLIERARFAEAALYVFGSVILSVLGLMLGVMLSRAVLG